MAAIALAALGIAGAAAGGALSYEQARKQNAAAKASKRSAIEAAGVESRQVRAAARQEAAARLADQQRTRARIAVLAGESGFDPASGDFSSLAEQVNTDASRNFDIIGSNESNQLARVQSGLHANLAAIGSHMSNSLLSTLQGSFTGASAGLQIGQAGVAIDQLGQTKSRAAGPGLVPDPSGSVPIVPSNWTSDYSEFVIP